MKKHTYYTAVGHFRRETNIWGQSRPVIIVNRKEYYVDIQEMALWTALNWRLLEVPQVQDEYDRLNRDGMIPALRTFENCLGRLCTRGLVASGMGDTDYEAIYDLLGGLYVSPLSERLPLSQGRWDGRRSLAPSQPGTRTPSQSGFSRTL